MSTNKVEKIIITGNLKQNPKTLKESISLVKNYIKIKKLYKNIELSIATPTVFLFPLVKEFGKKINIYSQNVSSQNGGAHTGENSAQMLSSIGVKNTIIGHSERRSVGEDNEQISKQIENALLQNMQITLCVGESQRYTDASHIKFVEDQLETALLNIKKTQAKNITIAYEPVWAIGQNATRNANQNEIYEMTIIIRKKLVEMFGRTAGGDIPIIYGGSVNKDNIDEVMSVHNISGILIGRASLDTKELQKIIELIIK